MKKIGYIIFVFIVFALIGYIAKKEHVPPVEKPDKHSYWFILHRKSNTEELLYGIPGNVLRSNVVKIFTVKTGIPGERPTPLPSLVGRNYWIVTDKQEAFDNPETAPYFLTLDVPGIEEEPYGPAPYMECHGQCNWILPGAFGLHGTASDSSKLSPENPGSSGCIRHRDEDIDYLYRILDPRSEEIRYYVEDN